MTELGELLQGELIPPADRCTTARAGSGTACLTLGRPRSAVRRRERRRGDDPARPRARLADRRPWRRSQRRVTGSVDGGLVVDLSRMRTVAVHPDERRRRRRGAMLGDVDAATQAHGLAVPLGVVSETGVAGPTLGRGGWPGAARTHGDNLVSAELSPPPARSSPRARTRALTSLGLRGGGGTSAWSRRSRSAHPAGPDAPVLRPVLRRARRRGAGDVRDFVAAATDEAAPSRSSAAFPKARPSRSTRTVARS